MPSPPRHFLRLAHESRQDRKSTRPNSSHTVISYAVFCLKKKENTSELQSHSDLVCRLLLEKHNGKLETGQHDNADSTDCGCKYTCRATQRSRTSSDADGR